MTTCLSYPSALLTSPEKLDVPTLFFVGAGIECVEGIKIAKQQGLRVIVSDANPKAPGVQYADAFIQASVYDSEATLRAAQQVLSRDSIQAVMTLGCDAPHTVSALAQHFAVPGHSPQTAALTTDKLRMKEQLTGAGVRVPWFTSIESLKQLQDECRRREGPTVLKPVDSRGSRGVLRLDDTVDLDWAYQYSLSHSPSRCLILEQWIEGRQISTESIVWDEKAVLCGIADRDYSRTAHLQPFLIEDGGETPAALDDRAVQDIAQVVHSAAGALGIDRGTVKGDVVFADGKPYIIEVAARLSGGYFCSHNIPLVYGIDIVGNAVKMALGQAPDWEMLSPQVHQHVANRFLFLPQGKIQTIQWDRQLVQHPQVKLFRLYVKPGDLIESVTNHTKRGGTVLTVGPTKAEAIELAEHVIRSITVTFEK